MLLSETHFIISLTYIDLLPHFILFCQIQAKLFTFDKTTQSWKEKGRGLMSLNDICQSTSEGIFQSRLGTISCYW